MKTSLIKNLIQNQVVGEKVHIKGWLKTRRDSKGGFSFLEINDGSCLKNLQVIVDNTLCNYRDEVINLYPGSSLEVKGTLVLSPGGKQNFELRAENVIVLGVCDPNSYPLQKQRISFERLREIAHLRARTNTFGAVARVRNALSFATHKFFQERDFYCVNTPIITTNDCEGAGQLFRVTTLDFNNLPKTSDGDVDTGCDFFGQQTSLTVSGQLEAETYACALGKIYTFGPTFRAENSNTSRHLAEFWMVEPEMAFSDLQDDIVIAVEYLKYLVSYVLEHCPEDMEFFNSRIDDSLARRLDDVVELEFEILPYAEAIDILAKNNECQFPARWGTDLQSEHERYLVEVMFKKPVIVIDFPKEIKPFYMRLNHDYRTVAAMDILLPGIGEIIGGSQREERLDVLTSRMNELNLEEDDYWWYLDLRRFGTIPHAGFGLGFERLVKFCTGMANIRDTIPFPRVPGNARF